LFFSNGWLKWNKDVFSQQVRRTSFKKELFLIKSYYDTPSYYFWCHFFIKKGKSLRRQQAVYRFRSCRWNWYDESSRNA